MKRTVAIVSLIAVLVTLLRAPALRAQESRPAVVQNEAVVDFPEQVTFRLELEASSPIVEATLTYQLGRDSCLTAGTQVPVEASGPTLEWTWVMSRSGNPPPGADMWWQWTVVDAAGNTITTPRKQLTFTDDRFEWRTVKAAINGQRQLQLNWYAGDEVGPTLLDAAVAGLDRLQQDTGITLQGDVQFFIYADSADMREALLYVQDWAGGIAFNDYNTILIGVPPHLADTWGSSTVRHELAHLVIGQFARSCLGGGLPTWLSEGLAVYAEGEPDEQTRSDINFGIENNAFQPVRSLNGAFPAHGDEASAAYSQSYSLVSFLLDAYGQEKMQQLLLTLADASGYDQALEQVYGFNANGLETVWRSAIGAPPRQIPPTPTPIRAASVPTVIPLGASQSRLPQQPEAMIAPTPELTGETPRSERTIRICGLGLVPLLFGGGAAVLLPRRRTGQPGD